MPQFFVDQPLASDREIQIRGADARHIAQSLRLRAGDWIVLSDGAGRSYRATITSSAPNAVVATIGAELPPRRGVPPPALALAAIRGERFEWAIEKAVELGCRHLLPFHSARTVRGKGDEARKLARWRTIALEAAKQSGLPFRPEIETAQDFDALCARFGDFSAAILFFEGEEKRELRETLRGQPPASEGLLIIGPEGGFTAEEVRRAAEAGAVTASLGPQILRVETAAVAALAICQYELGNMDIPGA
jgi:16S rRNA (uracil1498-N3)-methyltransferase